MTSLAEKIVDTNNGGYPDDIVAQLCLSLADGEAGPEFWTALIDLAARAGLETHALTLPLIVVGAESADLKREAITVASADDVSALGWKRETGIWSIPPASPLASNCLSDLFTIDGALEDRDGDLLPDATRIVFDLPESLPLQLGAAVANLAARIGLESGGVSFPMVGTGSCRFRVTPDNGEAVLTLDEEGWVASGEPQALAELVNRLAATWPHVTDPVTAGVKYSLGWLRRSLAGDGPEPKEPGQLEWEMQWSGLWEVTALEQAFNDWVLPRLDRAKPVELTVFASEHLQQRRRLQQTLNDGLVAAGFSAPRVTVLCAFKAGLSWLREVVIPELKERTVERVVITYQRYESDRGPGESLDMPIRWLQELFPGDELIAREVGIPIDSIRIEEAAPGQEPTYTVRALDDSRRVVGSWVCSLLHRTQPFIAAFPEQGNVCVTTGGFIVNQNGSELRHPVDTDLDKFWNFWQREVLQRVIRGIESSGGPAAERQPFFGELLAEVWISEPNSRLGVREENDSAAEALHEDIYFSALDTLEIFGMESNGERTSAPGRVVPIVHVEPGVTPHARVQLRTPPIQSVLPFPDVTVRSLKLTNGEFELGVVVATDSSVRELQERLHALSTFESAARMTIPATVMLGDTVVKLRLPLQDLIEAGPGTSDSIPPMDENICGESVIEQARSLSGNRFVSAWIEDYSFEGRPIVGLSVSLPVGGGLRSIQKGAILRPGCLIIARHHANEISSTNAAFRLAYLCSVDPGWRALLNHTSIVMLPYENVDGAALHADLSSAPEARTWKHHPARYNAIGYEFSEDFHDPDTRFGESRARPAIWRRWLPDFIVDNHGVPSHEWVQPFAGFGSPPRFRVSYWIPQALIYGIIRYVDDPGYPEHHQAMQALRDVVSDTVRATDIGALNREIGASYRFWGQSREPDRFPGVFHRQMLWHVSGGELDPAGRSFSSRFPKTTVLSWVTEVNDETATGEHLERTARAHLLANRAMLELAAASAPAIRHWRSDDGNGRFTLRVGRDRPLVVRHLED